MRIARFALFALLIAASTHPALAVDTVAWENSGDGLFNGTYNFREVVWRNKDDLRRVAIYGSIAFDGNGGYTLSSSVMDSGVGSVKAFSTTGAYRISASGMGFMDDPFRLDTSKPPNFAIWGLVTQDIFVGSSTDDGVNNLFIAAKAPSPAPTNASFNGSYWAAAVNFPTSSMSQARDMLFRLNPNGQGSLGTLNMTGFVGTSGTISQTVNGAAYSTANGVTTLSFGGSPLTQTLIAGDVLCYLSADGNFFFGGSASGWDMIVGVRAFPTNVPVPSNALDGMYYQAGVDVAPSQGFNSFVTYYGAFSAIASSGTIIGHQRILSSDPLLNYAPYDLTYSDQFTLATDGSHDDFIGTHNVVGAGGAIRIGFVNPSFTFPDGGEASRLGINIALKEPSSVGSGVYLDPTGIANAASSAPFTVGVSRGGFIGLYGSNLASTTLRDGSMPFTLGGVQVLINGRPAPVYLVSSGFVSAIVPFATTGTVASIQVINNNVASATRTVRIKDGTPGIYTNPAGGVGYVIAQHIQDNSYALITKQNPARPGETILMYLTGLGDVDPPVPDGLAAPSTPTSWAKNQPTVAISYGTKYYREVTPLFAGLTPTIVALYAIAFTLPADTPLADVYVNISLTDSYTTEAQIPIGGNSLANEVPGETTVREAHPRGRPTMRRPGTVAR